MFWVTYMLWPWSLSMGLGCTWQANQIILVLARKARQKWSASLLR